MHGIKYKIQAQERASIHICAKLLKKLDVYMYRCVHRDSPQRKYVCTIEINDIWSRRNIDILNPRLREVNYELLFFYYSHCDILSYFLHYSILNASFIRCAGIDSLTKPQFLFRCNARPACDDLKALRSPLHR